MKNEKDSIEKSFLLREKRDKKIVLERSVFKRNKTEIILSKKKSSFVKLITPGYT